MFYFTCNHGFSRKEIILKLEVTIERSQTVDLKICILGLSVYRRNLFYSAPLWM